VSSHFELSLLFDLASLFDLAAEIGVLLCQNLVLFVKTGELGSTIFVGYLE